MTAEPASPEETPAADFARPVLERQLARLERLSEIGMEIAEALGRRVAEDKAVDPAVVTLAFGRASRAVRMTCALQTEVVDKLRGVGRIEAYEAEGAAEVAAKHAAADLRLRARKLEIAEGVADAIDEAHETTEGRDHCAREARERLRDADDLGDILSRPVEDVIAQICRELGIARGLASLTPVHPDVRRDPGFLSSTAARSDPAPPDLEKTLVPACAGMNPEVEVPPRREPEPDPPPPDPDALPGYPVGLPGELPPERPRRRPYWQS